jgi:hypothetical protein
MKPNPNDCCSGECDRPAEPDHPMMLDGEVAPGDTEFMLRCFFEEYVQQGMSADDLWQMCSGTYFQALHAGLAVLGEKRVRTIIDSVVRDMAGLRVRHRELGVAGCGDLDEVDAQFRVEHRASDPTRKIGD